MQVKSNLIVPQKQTAQNSAQRGKSQNLSFGAVHLDQFVEKVGEPGFKVLMKHTKEGVVVGKTLRAVGEINTAVGQAGKEDAKAIHKEISRLAKNAMVKFNEILEQNGFKKIKLTQNESGFIQHGLEKPPTEMNVSIERGLYGTKDKFEFFKDISTAEITVGKDGKNLYTSFKEQRPSMMSDLEANGLPEKFKKQPVFITEGRVNLKEYDGERTGTIKHYGGEKRLVDAGSKVFIKNEKANSVLENLEKTGTDIEKSISEVTTPINTRVANHLNEVARKQQLDKEAQAKVRADENSTNAMTDFLNKL